MALDKNISALFAEQQKRIQAKKDEKDRMRKEKILRRDFKIKVGDGCLMRRPLAYQHISCSLLHAMSYLTLNNLDTHVCHKLLEAGFVQHLARAARSWAVIGVLTMPTSNQKPALYFQKVNRDFHLLETKMIQFLRSFPTCTQR